MAKKNHFEILGITRSVGEKEVKKAYLGLARQYHPDAVRDERLSDLGPQIQAIFVRLGQAYDVLRDVEKRGSYERYLGPAPRVPRTPAGSTDAMSKVEAKEPEPTPPAPPPETEEQRQFRLEGALRRARKHIAESQFWEAIQLLEPALEETEGTRLSISVRLLLGHAMGKNPHWRKRAEDLLLGVVRDEPQNAEGHFQLGAIYRQAGLAQRARAAMRKALELGHAAARAELQAMDDAPKDAPKPRETGSPRKA
jgi:tetratricopeptide (TPR) repeat protein